MRELLISQQAKLSEISDSSKLAIPLSLHVRGNKSCAMLECLIAWDVASRRGNSRCFPRGSTRVKAGVIPLWTLKSLFLKWKWRSPCRWSWWMYRGEYTRSWLNTFETSIFDHSHVPDYPERDQKRHGPRMSL